MFNVDGFINVIFYYYYYYIRLTAFLQYALGKAAAER